MSAAYGVHFGCTSACLAVNKDGKTDVIANDLGDRTTPCIVAFTDHDQAIGLAAKQGMIRNLSNTVCHVKQVLGRRCDHPAVVDYRRQQAVSVIDQAGNPVFEVDYKEARRTFTPAQIAVLIYKKMLETAQSHGGSGIQESVLAIPLHCSNEQKQAICSAAQQAGFNVLRMIGEPVAAVLAYDVGQEDSTEQSTVLVLRLGGVSTDVSIVNVQNGMYQTLTCVSDTTLGCDLFTAELAKYLVPEFKRQTRYDMSDNKRSMAKLSRAADDSKKTLSKLDNVLLTVESLYEGMDFNTKISRARFESCISDIVQRVVQLIDKVLKDNNFSRSDINKVILCGGGCNIPLIQKVVGDMFTSSELLNSINPEEVIAIGAAKQAGILTGLEDEDIKLHTDDSHIDCISKAICIMTSSESGPVLVPLFPVCAPLHSRKHRDFTLQDGQTAFALELFETDASLANEQKLAKIVMRDLPSGATVNSTFHLRRDGHLHVTLIEPSTSATESVTIETL